MISHVSRFHFLSCADHMVLNGGFSGHVADQRRMHGHIITKIIDLGWAGGGYNCFYAWYAIIDRTTCTPKSTMVPVNSVI